MKGMRSTLRGLLICLLIAGGIRADTVHLKNGKTLQGEVLKEGKDTVILKVSAGEITLRASDVDFIEYQTPEEYHLDLGRQLLKQNRLDDAVKSFQEAFQKKGDSKDAARALAAAYAQQGNRYLENKRFVEARDVFEKLRKLDPDGEVSANAAVLGLKEIETNEKAVDAIVAKARELAATDLSAAIGEYEHAMDMTPDARALVTSELAHSHVQRAVAYQQSGKLRSASVDLEAALELDPRLGDALEKLYISCVLPGILTSFRRSDLPSAQADLKRAHSITPANKNVLYLEGRLEEAQGHIAEAAVCYAKGLRIRIVNPTPKYTAELRETLENALGIKNGEWTIDTGFVQLEKFAVADDGPLQKYEAENFTIFHHNEALAREVADAAEYNRESILNTLKLQPWKGKAIIYIYRTQAEYTAKTGQPEWTGGISQYTLNGGHISEPRIHSWQTSPRLLKSVLPHEITHLILGSNLPDFTFMPIALHEGFAVMMEPKYRQDYFLDFLHIRFKSQSFIPLADLLSFKSYPRDPEFLYAEGYAILKYLSEKKGMPAALSLIRNCTAAGSAEGNLVSAAAVRSLEELETDWKTWIATKMR